MHFSYTRSYLANIPPINCSRLKLKFHINWICSTENNKDNCVSVVVYDIYKLKVINFIIICKKDIDWYFSQSGNKNS
jgi:hypothetical protein